MTMMAVNIIDVWLIYKAAMEFWMEREEFLFSTCQTADWK